MRRYAYSSCLLLAVYSGFRIIFCVCWSYRGRTEWKWKRETFNGKRIDGGIPATRRRDVCPYGKSREYWRNERTPEITGKKRERLRRGPAVIVKLVSDGKVTLDTWQQSLCHEGVTVHIWGHTRPSCLNITSKKSSCDIEHKKISQEKAHDKCNWKKGYWFNS